MKQDEIIRMAREAGFLVDNALFRESVSLFKRFAALVAAHEKKFWMEQIEVECNEAVLAEREACAKVCDEGWKEGIGEKYQGDVFAAAIRERSNANARARGDKE